jgi:hypothetical protein
MLNDYTLTQYCNDIAEEIASQSEDMDAALDLVWQYADGSEHVIYYAKAHELCRNCDTENGEAFIQDCFSDVPMTYDDMACRIAYGEIESRINHKLYEIFEAKEAA